MRACTGCGNWYGEAQESCPKCGIVAPAPPPPLPPQPSPQSSGFAPTAPDTWGPPAAPPAPPATVEAAWPAPVPASAVAAPPEQWAAPTGASPVSPPPPPPPPSTSEPPAAAPQPAVAPQASGARALWISLATVVAVVIVGAIGVQLFVNDDPPSALAKYVSGEGTDYSFPHDRTSVRLPRAAAVSSERENVGGRVYAETRALIDQPSYGLLYMRLIPAVALPTNAAKVQAIMHSLLLSKNDDLGVTFHSARATTMNGYPAVEVNGSYRGTPSDSDMVFANGNIYGFFVHAKAGAEKVLATFDQSLRTK